LSSEEAGTIDCHFPRVHVLCRPRIPAIALQSNFNIFHKYTVQAKCEFAFVVCI
jgi:hypothetical protein